MMMATAAVTEAHSQYTDTTPTLRELSDPYDSIQAEFQFLVKDSKHDNEKPYDLRYDPEGTIPMTNTVDEVKTVIIRDFRPLQDSRSFEEYGFCLSKVGCALTAADMDDEEKIMELYYPIIEGLLWEKFPDAAQIKILEHGVRKRHDKFPAVAEETVDFTQPATQAHIGDSLYHPSTSHADSTSDFSLYSAMRLAQKAFNITPDQYGRLLTVNFWKSFQKPGDDWPLAFCDHRTINYSLDTITADVVFNDKFSENERLYYSPRHSWYYFKNLGEDEAIMFQQTDTQVEGGGGVAHTSFYNSKAGNNAAPRNRLEEGF